MGRDDISCSTLAVLQRTSGLTARQPPLGMWRQAIGTGWHVKAVLPRFGVNHPQTQR